MSRALSLFQVPRPLYPERADDAPEGWLEEFGASSAGRIARKFAARRGRMRNFIKAVHAKKGAYAGLGLEALGEAARELRRSLRRDGLTDDLVASAFALVRETSGVALGMRHHDCQLQGGWVMLNGMIA
jgi:preprotein translocase subunit SecA